MNVCQFLKDKNVNFELITHLDTYDAQHMAASVHVPGRNVAKTVLLRADSGYRYFVVLLSADRAIDFEKASRLLGGSKLELASELDLAQHCPDCEFGALPPFGSQYGMTTMVDSTLAQVDEIVFESNTHHESVRMKFDDFRSVEQPLIGNFTFSLSNAEGRVDKPAKPSTK